MSRAKKVAVTVAFGVALALGGCWLKLYAYKAADRWADYGGVPVTDVQTWSKPRFVEIGDGLLLGGLIVTGLALHGWITAPRDDR